KKIKKGPIYEEVAFRSSAVPLFILAKMSPKRIIFLTPTIFGLAHVHHFYEFHISHPHHPLVAKIARTVLQFSYTTLFGAFVTFIYLRSGSLLACIVIHSFCNWMGLPRFWGRLEGIASAVGPQ